MAITVAVQPGPWVTLTFGSVYFWGLFLFWLNRVALAPARLEARLAWGPASAGPA
jgi:hypothetical protein